MADQISVFQKAKLFDKIINNIKDGESGLDFEKLIENTSIWPNDTVFENDET